MKLYLDDIREAPKGWTLIRTAEDCIKFLETNVVSIISLDHDSR